MRQVQLAPGLGSLQDLGNSIFVAQAGDEAVTNGIMRVEVRVRSQAATIRVVQPLQVVLDRPRDRPGPQDPIRTAGSALNCLDGSAIIDYHSPAFRRVLVSRGVMTYWVASAAPVAPKTGTGISQHPLSWPTRLKRTPVGR
jgi:hypothetical protein